MLSVQVFGPGGNDRNTAPEYFGLMGVAHGPLRRRHSGKGRAVPERLPVYRSFFVAFLWLYLSMPSSTGRARCAVLVTALCAGAPLAHARQLPGIESLSQSYVACVQSAFVRRLDDFGASNLPQATERAFLDCQLEDDAPYTTAVASAPGNTQAIPLVRAAIEQLKAKLKAELLAAPLMTPLQKPGPPSSPPVFSSLGAAHVHRTLHFSPSIFRSRYA